MNTTGTVLAAWRLGRPRARVRCCKAVKSGRPAASTATSSPSRTAWWGSSAPARPWSSANQAAMSCPRRLATETRPSPTVAMPR
jgi:hypothetical protein